MKKGKEFFWKYKFVFIPLLVLIVVELLFQVFYPSDRMLPIAQIDGLDVGGRARQDVVNELNDKYNNADIKVYFGNNVRPTFTVKPADLGVLIGNADRVNSTSYKWYLKLIPSSILWAGTIPPSAAPTIIQDSVSVSNFVAQNLGDSCNVKPVNAMPKVSNGSIKIIKMLAGGSCHISDVKNALNNIDYRADNSEARIPMDEIDADITDEIARVFAMSIATKLQRDVLITTESSEKFYIPGSEVMSWIDFEVVNKKLIVVIDKTKSGNYYSENIAPKVTADAGVTIITTNNLTDTIRENGSEGKVLNVDETNRRLAEFLMDERQSITVAMNTIFPSIEHTSRFESSSQGLEALIKYYAQTHDGDWSIYLYELNSPFRLASYNADQKFSIAGAARMIVAYTMLDRHEQGLQISDSNAMNCVKNVLSSYRVDCVDPSILGNLGSSIERLGLYNTHSSGRDIFSTAGDLGLFMQRLYDQRLGLEYSNNRIIYDGLQTAMPRNGISSTIGVNNLNATGSFANNLSDVAIVFTADTNYILVVLTSGVPQQNISELASQIQSLMSK